MTPWRTAWTNEITISRHKQHELDKAIADAEKRGYESVKRSTEVLANTNEDFNRATKLAANLGCNPKLKKEVKNGVKFIARMRKKQQN